MSEVRVPAWLGEALPLGPILLAVVFMWPKELGRSGGGGLFPKGTPPMLRGLPSRPDHLPKAPSPTITLGMRTWT